MTPTLSSRQAWPAIAALREVTAGGSGGKRQVQRVASREKGVGIQMDRSVGRLGRIICGFTCTRA